MGNRRIVILVAAAVVAAVAAAATWLYVDGADKRAYADAKLVRVFRVKQDVKKGLGGDRAIASHLIVADDMPERFRPERAIASLDVIRGKVALTELTPGQVVVEGQFVDQRLAASTFAQRIPNGQVAISVEVDKIRGVAHMLTPGDKVNLLVTMPPEGERTMLQNVDVIAVGTTIAPKLGDQAPAASPPAAGAQPDEAAGLVTFAVPPAAAQKIAYVVATKDANPLYLTLVPADNTPVSLPPTNAGNLFQGGLTPYGP